MTNLAFSILYSICLAFCVGVLEVVRFGLPLPDEVPPPQPIEEVAIAVPPRPEGVREVTGEGDEVYRYTEEACRALDGQYSDICFQQLARQRARTDVEGGLAACEMVGDAKMRMECTADVAELYSLTDRDVSLAICPTIPKKKWRDQCVFGIALTYSQVDSPWAFRLCDKAGKWRDFCRHDVNGEIAQVNLDLALSHCAMEEGDILRRKTCWHGIGKYVSRVDVDLAFTACERMPKGPDDLYVENCYHGLGWGASESAGKSFLSSCDRADDKAESCMLGIAYNLRRFDVDEGLQICEKVQRPDLRGQCFQFVKTGNLR